MKSTNKKYNLAGPVYNQLALRLKICTFKNYTLPTYVTFLLKPSQITWPKPSGGRRKPESLWLRFWRGINSAHFWTWSCNAPTAHTVPSNINAENVSPVDGHWSLRLGGIFYTKTAKIAKLWQLRGAVADTQRVISNLRFEDLLVAQLPKLHFWHKSTIFANRKGLLKIVPKMPKTVKTVKRPAK